jgi:hypothetical protein
VQRERSKLTTKDPPPTSETREKRKEKLSLLDRFEAIFSHLPPKPPRFSRPTIWHWDIQPENIFVKNGRVADIINWQGAWIGPLFLQARRPTLVRQHHGEMILELPDDYESIEDPAEKAGIADQVEKSILLSFYKRETRLRHQELHALFNLPQARRRREAVSFASSLSNDDDVVFLRDRLVGLQRYVRPCSLPRD